MGEGVKVDISKMKALAKALGDSFEIRVGILGNKAARKNGDGGLNNAELGFIQEFGSVKKKIPARSFLGMPLNLYLVDYLKSKKGFGDKEIKKAVKNGSLLELAKKVGIVAEQVVQDAFETRGFGNWAKNRPSTIRRKGSDSPLIDTGELRRSITSEAKKK